MQTATGVVSEDALLSYAYTNSNIAQTERCPRVLADGATPFFTPTS